MRKYQKITLEIEIAILSDREIPEARLRSLTRLTKTGIGESLRKLHMGYGGIKIRALVDQATLTEVNTLNQNQRLKKNLHIKKSGSSLLP